MVRNRAFRQSRIAPEIAPLARESNRRLARRRHLERPSILGEVCTENGFSLQQLKVGEQLNKLSVLTRELSNLDTESARREIERKEFLQADPLIPEQGGTATRDQWICL